MIGYGNTSSQEAFKVLDVTALMKFAASIQCPSFHHLRTTLGEFLFALATEVGFLVVLLEVGYASLEFNLYKISSSSVTGG